MTTPYYVPISTVTETTKTEGLPSPAAGSAAQLLDDGDKVIPHVVVSFALFFTFSVSAAHLWEDQARRHDVVFTAIVFLYLAVMINLLLVKSHDEKRRRLESCEVIVRAPKLTPSLMLVATVIMVVSLPVAVFVIHPDWLDLVFVALCVLALVPVMFVLLIVAAFEQKKYLRAKREVNSDLA